MLSKADLVEAAEIAALTARIRHINPRSPIGRVDFGRAPLDGILDIRGFNLNEKLEIDPAFLADEATPHSRNHTHEHECDSQCAHGHDDEHGHQRHHEHGPHHARHSDDISAFVFKSERPFDTARLDDFLGHIVQVFGPSMLRYKGVLLMAGADRKVVFQGVHQLMGTDIGARWAEGEHRASKMVFIGKNLPKDVFILGLEQCLV